MKTEAETGVMPPSSRDAQNHQKPRRKGAVLSQRTRGSAAPPALARHASSLQREGLSLQATRLLRRLWESKAGGGEMRTTGLAKWRMNND